MTSVVLRTKLRIDSRPMISSDPTRGWPASRANSDHGPHADTLRVLGDQRQFGVFFNHRDDPAADLLGQHRHLDVFVVFEAVADDWRIVVGERHHRQQFGLRPGFQTELVRLAKLENLFHYLALLIHFNRINAAVLAVVFVFMNGSPEGIV